MSSSTFPTALDAFTNPVTADTLDNVGSGATTHHGLHTKANDALAAIEAYLGTNASQTTPTGSNRVLASTSASASTWTATPTLTSIALTGDLTLSGSTRHIWTSDANELDLGANATAIVKLTSGGGAQVGSPAGGDKGSGTLNATTLYQAGTAVASTAGPSFTGGVTIAGGLTLTHNAGDQVPRFQNSADNGKQFQRVESASVTTSSAVGNIFNNSSGTSWPSTFGGTPVAQVSGDTNSSSGFWSGSYLAISTTSITPLVLGARNSDSGKVECWGFG